MGDVERAAGAVSLALKTQAMDAGRIRVDSLFPVQHQCAWFPTFPQAERSLHELFGAIVARVVLLMSIQTVVARLSFVYRGYDVPSRPPTRQVV
jgi:hypothetical protein